MTAPCRTALLPPHSHAHDRGSPPLWQALWTVMMWSWLWTCLRPRVCLMNPFISKTKRRRSWLAVTDGSRAKSEGFMWVEDLTHPSQRQALQRQAQLQEYMARLMNDRLQEHQHRLSSLRLRLTLLNTPRQVWSCACHRRMRACMRSMWRCCCEVARAPLNPLCPGNPGSRVASSSIYNASLSQTGRACFHPPCDDSGRLSTSKSFK